MKGNIHRSLLILPANVPKFVEKAYLRNADAIMLDLEDAVPPSEKENARGLLAHSVEVAGKGGADVFVRVNNEPDMIDADVNACVLPGLHAVFVPKVEDPAQIAALDHRIGELEQERGIVKGAVRLSIHIESPLGMLGMRDIATASPRIESMSIGTDDYCLQLGVEPSPTGQELFLPFSMMVNVCRAYGVNPMGILGSVASYRDLDAFRYAAERGRNLGAIGAFCIHPDQVLVLNEVFSPRKEIVEQAGKIIDVFEEALKQGRASTSLDGKMVDTPIYKRAKRTLSEWDTISRIDAKKAAALEKLK
jgi:citrate lyase subunit beta/citryl-CoA lyase